MSLRASLNSLMFILQCALSIFALSATVYAQASTKGTGGTISIVAWNIEIGGSDVATIKGQLDDLKPFDIIALSEVPKKAASEFTSRWGEEASIVGEKGGEACLLITWDPGKFERIRVQELTHFNEQEFAPGVQVAPLIAQLRHKASGTDFIVMMNHLTRGSAELRQRQATLLVEWAKQQTLPVIAVGGYNFDFDIPTQKGNPAFDVFMKDSTWKWIQPKPMVDTNWSDRNNDGKDDYPDSMLDFAFAAGPAKQWTLRSEVIVRANDFPDNEETSDQRPIRTTVELSNPPAK